MESNWGKLKTSKYRVQVLKPFEDVVSGKGTCAVYVTDTNLPLQPVDKYWHGRPTYDSGKTVSTVFQNKFLSAHWKLCLRDVKASVRQIYLVIEKCISILITEDYPIFTQSKACTNEYAQRQHSFEKKVGWIVGRAQFLACSQVKLTCSLHPLDVDRISCLHLQHGWSCGDKKENITLLWVSLQSTFCTEWVQVLCTEVLK